MSIFSPDEFDGVDTVPTVVAMVTEKCQQMLDSKAVVGTDDYSRGIRRGHRDAAISMLSVLAKVRTR